MKFIWLAIEKVFYLEGTPDARLQPPPPPPASPPAASPRSRSSAPISKLEALSSTLRIRRSRASWESAAATREFGRMVLQASEDSRVRCCAANISLCEETLEMRRAFTHSYSCSVKDMKVQDLGRFDHGVLLFFWRRCHLEYPYSADSCKRYLLSFRCT